MPAIPLEQALQMALALRQTGRLAEAEAAYLTLGNSLAEAGRWGESVAAFQQALALVPNRPETHFNLGNTHARSGDLDAAIACFRQALALRPEYGKAHTNLGNVLMERHQLEEAVANFEFALALQPNAPEMHYNLGVALSRSGRWDDAIACYRRAIALKPDYADALWALAPDLLRLGHFEEGWRLHARHGHCPEPAWPQRKFTTPQWDGSDVDGQTILIHEEQGHGDLIQFLRYVPLVRERARAGRVILECPPLLSRLVRQSGSFRAEIVDRSDLPDAALPHFDRHIAFLDLPFALGLWEPLPMAEPYLQVASESRALWRKRLGAQSRFRVGLAWAGNPKHLNDRRRSMPAEELLPLLRVPGVDFYSLQIKPAGDLSPALLAAGLIDMTASIADFADTAALIAELDLIITVDTAVAHLAGALGRPVWTLLPFVPEWRWGVEREDASWYSSMKLFRQPAPGDWRSVIRSVVEELPAAVSKHP